MQDHPYGQFQSFLIFCKYVVYMALLGQGRVKPEVKIPLPRLLANTRLQHLRLCSVLLTNMFLTRCHFGAGVMYGTNQPKCRLPEKYLVTFVAPPLAFIRKTQNLTKLWLTYRAILMVTQNFVAPPLGLFGYLVNLIWKNCDYFDCYSNRGTVWANFWIHRK